MTRFELQQKLIAQRVREDAYCLDGSVSDECYILEKCGTYWIVYYSERGLKNNQHEFRTESEACLYLYGKLSSDPTVKVK